MLLQDPTQIPAAPPQQVVCSHTKKPCEHATALYQCVASIKATIDRRVLIGAMFGASVGSAAKDLLQGWLG